MTFTVMGDSISSFEGTIPQGFRKHYPAPDADITEVGQMWWARLEVLTGWKMVCNDSYSASRITPTGEYPPWSAFLSDRRIELLKGDAVIVLGGTNDWGQKNPVTKEYFTEAYRKLIGKVRGKLPHAELCFCTPLRRLSKGFDEKNCTGWSQHELQDTVRDLVHNAMRRDSHIHLLDLARIPMEGKLADGLHPNKAGMEAIAVYLARQLS